MEEKSFMQRATEQRNAYLLKLYPYQVRSGLMVESFVVKVKKFFSKLLGKKS